MRTIPFKKKEWLCLKSECDCHEIIKNLRSSQTPYFQASNIHERGFEFPADFVRDYGDGFTRRVSFQASSSGEVLDVTLKTLITPPRSRVKVGMTDWKNLKNVLDVWSHDLLIFSLVAMSKFIVHIIREHDKKMNVSWVPYTGGKTSYKSTKRSFKNKSGDDYSHHEAGGNYDPHECAKTSISYCLVKEYQSQQKKDVPPQFMKRVHKTGVCSTVSCERGDQYYPRFELPAKFVQRHAKRIGIGDMVKLQSCEGCRPGCRVWDVKCKVWQGVRQTRVVLTEGWEKFSEDNQLQEGDWLDVALVADSRFVVTIYSRRDASSQDDELEENFDHNACEKTNVSYRRMKKHRIQQTKSVPTNFSKRIRRTGVCEATSCPTCGHARRKLPYFELPANFVHLHANKIGDMVKLQSCQGHRVWDVKCHVSKGSSKTRVFLTEGWKEFSHDNQLQEGDRLDFDLVAQSKFFVTIYSREY